MWKKFGDINPLMHSVKMVEHNLRILQCTHLKIVWKGRKEEASILPTIYLME